MRFRYKGTLFKFGKIAKFGKIELNELGGLTISGFEIRKGVSKAK